MDRMDTFLQAATKHIDFLHQRIREAALQIFSACDVPLKPTTVDDSSPRGRHATQQELHGCDEPLIALLLSLAEGVVELIEHQEVCSSDGTNGAGASKARFCAHGMATPPVGQLAKLLHRLDDLIGIAYERFYAYVFSDLSFCWRALYTEASILKFGVLLSASTLGPHCWDRVMRQEELVGHIGSETGSEDDDMISALIRPLDLAIILAGAAGQERGRRWIDKTLDILGDVLKEAPKDAEQQTRSSSARTDQPPKKRQKRGDHVFENAHHFFSTYEPFTPPVTRSIRRMAAPSMEAFQGYLNGPHAPQRGPDPLVLTGLTNHWPARTTHPWASPSYLLSATLGGRRLVPIELGRSYVDDGWGQKIVTMKTLLDTYISPPPPSPPSTTQPKPPTAYLAQHPLLTQLPVLAADITTPDLCYTCPPPHPTDASQNQPELDAPKLNAWLGPPGTITPLHTDPYHNLLVQVVGRKYVRLYAPHEGERMRPRGREGGVEMGNTSCVDVGVVEGWDEVEGDGDGVEDRESERFREVPFVDCILEPGDALYIPIGWWHYVRGLSVSFSVSFWWN